MARCRAALCAIIASGQRNSVSSCAWPPAFARSSRGLACENSWRHRRRPWSRLPRAAPVAPCAGPTLRCARPGPRPARSCRVWSPADPAVAAAVAGVSTLGFVTVRVETGARALPGAARWGSSPCWLSSQPPFELAASWKGSSMLARMTPTPEAPGRRRQVVCSCEGPPSVCQCTQGYEAAVIGDVIAITVFAFTDRLRRPHRITCPPPGPIADPAARY